MRSMLHETFLGQRPLQEGSGGSVVLGPAPQAETPVALHCQYVDL